MNVQHAVDAESDMDFADHGSPRGLPRSPFCRPLATGASA
ncbi:hypothetical protein WQQ_19660 [Hydrocarboniphaga effusa AP103]|uniref:Uncharacterized protein n=1 Tax=Hydrocarboniphaga effusa AP103 TaxID=1172194 RepID=I7ZIS8_9GAMM|nr:hypothetical protein WQQ_19660 [Hydrocarboniphaga effusa AP103]